MLSCDVNSPLAAARAFASFPGTGRPRELTTLTLPSVSCSCRFWPPSSRPCPSSCRRCPSRGRATARMRSRRCEAAPSLQPPRHAQPAATRQSAPLLRETHGAKVQRGRQRHSARTAWVSQRLIGLFAVGVLRRCGGPSSGKAPRVTAARVRRGRPMAQRTWTSPRTVATSSPLAAVGHASLAASSPPARGCAPTAARSPSVRGARGSAPLVAL